MFKIEYENMNFIDIMKNLSGSFVELPITIDSKGLSIVAIGSGSGAVINIVMGKDDHKAFAYDGKKPQSFVIPFGEFLNVTDKLIVPIEFSDNGQKVCIKSGKATFQIEKLADADVQSILSTAETVKKNRGKAGGTEVIIKTADIVGLMTLLDKISGNGIKFVIENGKLRAESTKQLASGTYEFDTVVDKKFMWTGVVNPTYIKLIKNLGKYAGNIHFFFNSSKDEDILYAVVEFNLGPNSNAILILSFLEDYNIVPGVAATDEVVEEEYANTDKESDSDEDFDKEEDET